MHGHEDEDLTGSEWTEPGLMFGPVKMVAFYDECHHGAVCLIGRAGHWLMENEDWQVVDMRYGFGRMIEGEVQLALVLYVEDRANEIKPIMSLDEPMYAFHKTMAEGPQPGDDSDPLERLRKMGAHVFMGDQDSVAERMRVLGVPEEVIRDLLRDLNERKNLGDN